MIRCRKLCRSVMSMTPRSTLALATTSGVPSVEPPSEFTRTARYSGKYLARPAMTALTTCPIVLELLKLGMPTRISACAISRICVSVRSSKLNSVASSMLGSLCFTAATSSCYRPGVRESRWVAFEAREAQLRDVHAHFVEPCFGVAGREVLMLVLVLVREIGLADPTQGTVPIDLGQNPDFDPPVSWDAIGPSQIRQHGKLARQGIAEAVQKAEQGIGTHQALEGSDHRGDKETRGAAVQAVCDPGVVALAEIVPEIGVRDRVAEAGQILSVVRDDVAVVQSDDLASPHREDVAEGDPAGLPLPRPADIDVLADQEVERFLDPRPFDPNQPNVLGQNLEIVLGPPELQGGGMAQSDDALAQIRDLLDVLNDPVEGRPFQLGVQTRKDKRDGAGLGVRSEERRVGKECRSRWSPDH